MGRRTFAQILKEANVDIRREYDRLYNSFYIQKFPDSNGIGYTLKEYCAAGFMNMPFRGTCLSLDDFDDFYGIYYERNPNNFDIDYLISFCEYTYNLTCCVQVGMYGYMMGPGTFNQVYMQQIAKVVEAIGYMFAQDNCVTIFVPKSAEAISVSEILDPALSYKVIEYNHHTLHGNLTAKKNTILLLADKLEPQRKKIKQINRTLEDNLFFLFNNLNLRHNNCDKESENYNRIVAEMSAKDLESWYDETYQLCLLTFLELDNIERTQKIKGLKKQVVSDNSSK